MTLQANRLQNGRKEIAKFGGVAKLSRHMGYKNASFLSQMFGPNQHDEKNGRAISEKTTRKMESALGLPKGYLDQENPVDPAPAAGCIDVDQLAAAITQVNLLLAKEGVTLAIDKQAKLIAMTYDDGNPDRLHSLVQLLK
jgi:hypothetical protein